MKPLFTFDIFIEQEVEKIEIKNENGQEISTKSKIKEKVPYTFIMKRPARRENDDLRLFYGEQMAKAIERGLMTKAILVNKHIDGAGALLSQETAKRISDLYETNESLKQDITKIGIIEESEDKREKQEKLLLKLLENKRELDAIESSSQAVFSNTAETYAQERANVWLILNQTYIQKNGKIEPFFKGKTFVEKEDYYFDLEENEDPLYNAVRERLVFYWAMYSLNRADSVEDFKILEKELEENFKKAEEKKTEEKIEPTTSIV